MSGRVAVALMLIATGCTSVDSLMHDYEGERPGASVLVLRDGEVVFRKAYGLADVENRIAATPETHYRLASVSKQFTAAAILTLADRGKLSLDDPIRKYLPSLPSATDAITIRHLLTHSSGLIDYEDVMPATTTAQLKDADVLRLLESQTSLYFAPGSGYRYSNSGYALLALIVEKVSGRSFARFLRDDIFLPLGMNTTVAHEEGISTVPQRAYGHTGTLRTDQSLTSAVLGDGGIYTSVDQLVPWLLALDRGKFAEASVPRVQTDVEGMSYGYGWRIHTHNGRGVVSHTGESIGFRNALVRFPYEGISVVVLTNRNEGDPLKIALEIAEKVRPSSLRR
jgi:CubicO group peptidase (beta-lactamase class C family)